MSKKRGQITVFIIIGIVILIAFAAFFLIKDKSIQFDEEELVVEPELVPIKEYFETCLYNAGKTRVGQLGMQSGFMSIPADITNTPRSFLNYDPDGILKIPFWHYDGEYNIPDLEDIEDSLQGVIINDTITCLQDFAPLKDRYNIESQGELEVIAIINAEDIIINAIYPIKANVKGKQESSKIKYFRSILPVRFKRAYDLAKEIIEKENDYMFFENLTIDLMAMNQDIPFSGMDFSCSPKIWTVPALKEEIKTMVYNNLPRVRVKNTDHPPFLEEEEIYQKYDRVTDEDVARKLMTEQEQRDLFDNVALPDYFPDEPLPEDAYDYFHLYFDSIENDHSEMKVSFKHLPSWPLRLVSRPSENGVMSSRMGEGNQQYLSFICINAYHFTYDVEYPILTTIYDSESYKGSGYTFRFAFPVLVDHNQGNRRNTGTTIFEVEGQDLTRCQNLEGNYEIAALGDVDGFVNWELPNVNLSLNCLAFTCPLGSTDPDGGRLTTGLPSNCKGGFVVAEKDGYLKTSKQITSSSSLIQVQMPKLKKFNISLRKHSINNPAATSYSMGIGDTLSIILSNQEYDHNVYFSLNKSSQFKKEIEIIGSEDTIYTTKLMLMDADTNFYGGYNFNWTYRAENIEDLNHITFHVLEQIPKPDTSTLSSETDIHALYENFRIFQEINNIEHLDYLKPEFS